MSSGEMMWYQRSTRPYSLHSNAIFFYLLERIVAIRLSVRSYPVLMKPKSAKLIAGILCYLSDPSDPSPSSPPRLHLSQEEWVKATD